MNALVSIIIPTFNRAHLIGETLDSILAQTYKNWECIVIDDGSTDNTAEVMETYLKNDIRFQYHHRPKHRLSGGNEARNFGFELSKGSYIQWFDSDDLMHENKIKKNIKQFTLRPNIVVSICSVTYFIDTKQKERLINMDTVNLYEDYVLRKIAVSCQVPLWSKRFLEKEELFNPLTLRGQEFELYTKLFYKVKSNFGLIKDPLVYIRNSENSITKHFHKGKDKYLISYLEVIKTVLQNIINQKNRILYTDFLKVYLRYVLFLVRIKKYTLAFNALSFLYNNRWDEKIYFKLKLLKKYLIIFLIKITNGKLYYRLKKSIILQ